MKDTGNLYDVAKSWRRRFVISVLVFGTAAVGVGAFFVWERFDSSMHGPLQDIEIEQEMARFVETKDIVFELIDENDGYLPADLYRALIETHKVESYAYFSGESIVFPLLRLPARVNTDLGQNRRLVLFWKSVSMGEKWLCYSNGTWERWGKGGRRIYYRDGTCKHLKTDRLDYDFEIQAWDALKSAGYPVWRTVTEKEQWIRDNKKSLVWDETVRMYIVPTENSIQDKK